MYKIIYAHDVHKANLLGNAQLQERERKKREREKRERREKKGKKTFSSHKHPSTGSLQTTEKRETEICLFFSLSERAYLLLSNTTKYISFPISSYTHTRVYSRKNHLNRAHLNSHAQTHIPLFPSHTQNTPQSKKDVLLYHFHRRENRPKIRPPKAIG